jgi:hypothetical protein
METHNLAIDAAYNALVETYTKVYGKMWEDTIRPAMDFKIVSDGEQEVIRSTDGFVELQVEKTNSFGRAAWEYNVYAVFDDDIGETSSSFSPNLASYKFIEIHLSMRLACIHNLQPIS